jgi:hypothetical protein
VRDDLRGGAKRLQHPLLDLVQLNKSRIMRFVMGLDHGCVDGEFDEKVGPLPVRLDPPSRVSRVSVR